MTVTITAFYASLLALLFIVLSFKTINLRKKHLVGVGDGGEQSLTRAIRVHGNFSEYTPLALILLGAYELSGASAVIIHLLGASFFLARILHALGLGKSAGTSKPRFFGMIITFLVLLILAILNISYFLALMISSQA
ncbi:MAG: MAPEG family protein [Colwellia sp.]